MQVVSVCIMTTEMSQITWACKRQSESSELVKGVFLNQDQTNDSGMAKIFAHEYTLLLILRLSYLYANLLPQICIMLAYFVECPVTPKF